MTALYAPPVSRGNQREHFFSIQKIILSLHTLNFNLFSTNSDFQLVYADWWYWMRQNMTFKSWRDTHLINCRILPRTSYTHLTFIRSYIHFYALKQVRLTIVSNNFVQFIQHVLNKLHKRVQYILNYTLFSLCTPFELLPQQFLLTYYFLPI